MHSYSQRYTRRIEVTFQDEKDSSVKSVRIPLGTSLLEAAHENHIDLEGKLWPFSNWKKSADSEGFQALSKPP